jgi:hypothetical protein
MEFSGTFGKVIQLTGRNIYNIPDSRIYINYPEETNRILSFSGNGETGIYFSLPRLTEKTNSIIYYNTINYSIITGIKYIDIPFVSGFSPVSGRWGDTIHVSGKEFIEVTGVFVGDRPSENFFTSGENNLFFTIPDKASLGPVEIRTTGGTVSTSFSGIFNTGSFTGDLQIIVPPIAISGFTPDRAKYNEEIFVTGRSFQKVNLISLTGIRNLIDLDVFDILGTTGIKFRLPSGVLNANPFRLSSVGFVLDGETTVPTGFEVVETEDKLYITGYSIINIIDNTGKYQDIIPISGTNMQGRSFFFQGYTISGERPNYIESLSYNYINNEYVELEVPKEIIRGPIYISGEEGLRRSEDHFTPIPTIFETSSKYLTIGTEFKIKARNASEIYKVLGISGFNQYENKTGIYIVSNQDFSFVSVQEEQVGKYASDNYFGNISLNFDSLHDRYPSGIKTGHVLITGLINNSFVGTGFLFLASKNNLASEFDTNIFTNILNLKNSIETNYEIPDFQDALFTGVTFIDSKIPVILGFKERVARSGELEVTGKYLMSITGFLLKGFSETGSINSGNFVGIPEQGIVTKLDEASSSNVYEAQQVITIRTQDLGFTEKSGSTSIERAYSELPVKTPEAVGSVTTFASAAELNNAMAGTEVKSFSLSDPKTELCLKTLDIALGYGDNVGSSTFNLSWVGDVPINYGNLTVEDVTTEGGVNSCWQGNFTSLPAGTYGRYSITFVSGNFSPNGGALYNIGVFTFSKLS